jgi:hypothetical protein
MLTMSGLSPTIAGDRATGYVDFPIYVLTPSNAEVTMKNARR